jgi:hypothetical protein
MESRSCKLLETLLGYYKNNENMQRLLNIINNDDINCNISLRLIDWLVSNYSKSQNIVYYIGDLPFNMHQNYKNMLKAYSKKLFDPFRRHERIYLPCDIEPNIILETTVAQLMFFKWAFENLVIDYAYSFKDNIKQNMDIHTHHRLLNKGKMYDTHRLKRKELSKQNKCVNMYQVNMKVSFN